jgi:asparagine synthase (glutamine-hydrolysing)
MPGLFGYWSRERRDIAPGLIAGMAAPMRHQPGLLAEHRSFLGFAAGRVHLGFLQPGQQPRIDRGERHALWLDGEIANLRELAGQFRLDAKEPGDDASCVLSMYDKVGWSFLHGADGIFSIALYDLREHRLTLVSDRHGLRPLYWMNTPSAFAFAGEVKALLPALPGPLRIDPLAVRDWFSFGYLMENRTWIAGIELLPAATILDITPDGVKQTRYWSWQKIPAAIEEKDGETIIEEIGRLWKRAVARRAARGRIGQFLSGGLDSRAILAALPPLDRPYQTVTFGTRQCDDARIARLASVRAGVPNHLVELNTRNWLQRRVEALWRTDGMGRLLDLHGSRATTSLSQHFDIHLHGFLGDATIGGSYAQEGDTAVYWRSMILQKVTSPLQMPGALDHLERLHASSGITPERFLLEQRGRRLVNTGLISLSSFVEARLPFYDADLLSLVLAIPGPMRAGSAIYNRMLLRHFPALYRDIPWQRTGKPIQASTTQKEAGMPAAGVGRMARHLLGNLLAASPARTRRFADYPAWLRSAPGHGLATRLLLDRDPRFAQYIDRDAAQRITREFMESRNDGLLAAFGMLLSFELFLRCLERRSPLPVSPPGVTSQGGVRTVAAIT